MDMSSAAGCGVTALYRAIWGGPVWKQVENDMPAGARWDVTHVRT